jgi:hypothetical protein
MVLVDETRGCVLKAFVLHSGGLDPETCFFHLILLGFTPFVLESAGMVP